MHPTDFFQVNLIELGLFFVGVAYVITFWKQGATSASKDVIQTLKDQHELNVQKIAELTHDLGVLQGQLDEKDKRISLLEKLVKTTPEQEQYMLEMRQFTQKVAEYMDSSTKTLGEVSVFMHNINTQTNK